jgi:hypothetical protein
MRGPVKITGVSVPPARESSTRPRLERMLAVVPPWLSSLSLRSIFRMPVSSPLRRSLLRWGMARAWAAANRDDWWFIPIIYEPDCEIVVATEFRTLGLADNYRGHGASRELADAWRRELPDIRWDPERVIDLGDRWVLQAQMSGRGRSSGALTSRTWGCIYHLSSRSRIARQSIYWTWDEALAAAGL